MTMLIQWESQIKQLLLQTHLEEDPAHDFAHLHRVAVTAKHLAKEEDAKLEIVIPASWLHDLINLPKNHPERHMASRYSAEAAIRLLKSIQYPNQWFDDIHHAISAHSFSAQIEAKTIEAKIIQDADRLDSLGAIGIARTFTVGGALKRPIYDFADPFAEKRLIDDTKFTIDHFYAKLFKIETTLLTAAGRREGQIRVHAMSQFLQNFKNEIEHGKRISE